MNRKTLIRYPNGVDVNLRDYLPFPSPIAYEDIEDRELSRPQARVSEWFDLSAEDVAYIQSLGCYFSGQWRTLDDVRGGILERSNEVDKISLGQEN